MAFAHAYTMTHFVDGGPKRLRIEQLNTWQKVKVLFTGVRLPKPVNGMTPADVGLDFDTRSFTADGINLEAWYVPAPGDAERQMLNLQQASPKGMVIAFPGYGSSKDTLCHHAVEFHDMGYAVLLVDFRGCGGSGGSTTTVGFKEADDVAAAVAYARNTFGPQPIILVGESMGAAAILRAVADGQVAADALILESPFDKLLTTVENRFHSMGMPTFPFAPMLVFWGGVQQGYPAYKHNPMDYAGSVHTPTLIFHGGLDARVSIQQSRAVFDHLAGPRQFELFPNAGHCGMLTQDRSRWCAVVSTFLAAHIPANHR
jgi:alpha-beta hydrolase superfamily lysophospholipase